MKFDRHNKVMPESLTQQQAKKFDKWLLKELRRHKDCINDALWRTPDELEIEEILESAVIRHREAMKGIYQTRIKLRELFEL